MSASHFPPELLESLRPRLPEYLEAIGLDFKRQGSRLVTRCPAHEDRSPSFAIFGSHHEVAGCHPCGFTGDILAVSRWLGRSASFPEAVADVCTVLGVTIAGQTYKPGKAPQKRVKPPEAPFVLSDADRATIDRARLAFSDAYHGGDPIIDRIAGSLGIDREILRLAAWGSCGMGLANGWLAYAYPSGLKWRNPDPDAKPRFRWLVGKALAPWRAEWITERTQTVYLTEGESDCLALKAAGLEDDGTGACVASPGTGFQARWAPLFRGKRVVLCFDIDAAGRAATASVAAMLKGHASQILTWKGTNAQ